jgi:hypothetical protein
VDGDVVQNTLTPGFGVRRRGHVRVGNHRRRTQQAGCAGRFREDRVSLTSLLMAGLMTFVLLVPILMVAVLVAGVSRGSRGNVRPAGTPADPPVDPRVEVGAEARA